MIMTLKQVLKKLIELQELAWQGDDLMDQEVLFEVQDKLSALTLEVAQSTKDDKVTKALVDKFPWLYELCDNFMDHEKLLTVMLPPV